MEYGKPQKLADGRYFLKISGARHQVNGLVLQGQITGRSVTFKTDSKVFSDVDTEIVNQAKSSKQEWFGKELSDDWIQSAYQESVTTDGVLDASLSVVRGEVTCQAYDTQKAAVPLQDVADGATVDGILELAGLCFLKKSFSPVWRVLQLRVRTSKPKAPEYLFSDDPEERPDEDDPSDYLD
jgi:hypothetical protein